MKLKEKIILIDDEKFEVDILNYSLAQLNYNYEVLYFSNPFDAFDYLTRTRDKIFLIISDMNMPKQSGMGLKRKIDEHEGLRKKSIPFIFLSSSATEQEISEAYDYRVQGYFKKPLGIEETTKLLDIIIKYWQQCRHPNTKIHI